MSELRHSGIDDRQGPKADLIETARRRYYVLDAGGGFSVVVAVEDTGVGAESRIRAVQIKASSGMIEADEAWDAVVKRDLAEAQGSAVENSDVLRIVQGYVKALAAQYRTAQAAVKSGETVRRLPGVLDAEAKQSTPMRSAGRIVIWLSAIIIGVSAWAGQLVPGVVGCALCLVGMSLLTSWRPGDEAHTAIHE